MRTWLGLLGALLALSSAALADDAGASCPKPATCPSIGSAAPPFGLPLASGARTSLRELLAKKKPVILSFWRHDCAPCIAEFPALQKLAEEWGDRASIVLVHVGGPEEKMRSRLEQWHVSLPAALDAFECTGVRYCADSFPQLWVLDATGTVRAHFKGAPADFAKAVRAAVEPLLAAPAAR
jgi:thiol-disulfide isomerase/thioredoxin